MQKNIYDHLIILLLLNLLLGIAWLVLYHWHCATEESKDYPFIQFNNKLSIPSYSDEELHCM